MKVYLRSKSSFSQEAQDFYNQNFELVDEKDAEVIVINSFERVNYPDKIVAFNATCPDNVVAKEIIDLRGEDLSDLTSVAELTLGMMILLMRNKGEELKGRTIGIIGSNGRIGTQLSDMVWGMQASVIGYDIKNSPKFDLSNLLKDSDIVSLNITANEENRDFMGKDKFERMKDGAIFLNSARPWLVEEEGLKWALDNKLSSAWFDFILPFEHEKLWQTPHMGGATKQSRAKTESIIAKKLHKLYN